MPGSQNEVTQRAQEALNKPAAYGEDVDPQAFKPVAAGRPHIDDLRSLDAGTQATLAESGIEIDGARRSGSFIQMDHSVVYCGVQQEGLEIMSTTEVMERYPWMQDYWWKAVAPDADKYTARAELHQEHGYFIRALPGVKSIYPLQACLYIGEDGLEQDVHNVIIAEEGSELHIITGCTTGAAVRSGLHVGISEFFIKRGAKVTFTMIHNWAEEVAVRPRTGTIIEEDGLFLSNYVCMRPVRTLQMYPTSYLAGRGAVARYYSILAAPPGSHMDVGSRAVLQARGTRAEIIARTLTTGGTIINRGAIVGEVPGVKAHLECRGLMLANVGMIHAIPELVAKAADVDLSHEAAVGKIAPEEIEYLMARGLSEEEATAAIVRGFINVQITGLPAHLQEQIDKAIALGEKSLL